MNPIRKIQSSPFLKNVSILMTGTVIASIIPAIVQPILTRIYTPADFGLYGLYFAFIGVFTSVSGLRYELAVPLPQVKEDTDRMAMITIFSAACVSVLLFIFSYIFRFQIAEMLNNERMASWILIVPFGVFVGGIYQAFNYWLIRHKAFKSSAINRVTQKVVDSPVMVVLGYLSFGAGQVVGDFTGRAMMGLMAMFQAIKNGFTFKSFEWKRVKKLASQYRDFPLFSTLPTLADSIGLYIPVMLISSMFSDNEAGFYTNTRNLLSIPLIFISRNLSQVLLERFVSRKNNKLSVLPEVRKIFWYLILSTIPFIIILILFAPQLFVFVFGENWKDSGIYTQILVVSYALRFVNGSLTVVFSALERIRLASYWQVYFFFAIISLSLLKQFNLSAYEFIGALMLVEAISYSIYLWLVFKVARQYDASLK